MSAREFIDDDFLLRTKAGRALYHEYARDLPIIDYHCHLPVAQIAEDHRFRNIAEIWLAEDHYKWRAMRANGVAERFCTGDASDWEKFLEWAGTVPAALGNPLYHWTHLELSRIFGVADRLLSPQTALEIWERCNALLAQPDFSARGIMRRMKVQLACTTDDPADSLEHHKAIAEDRSFKIKVLPTWRTAKAMGVKSPQRFSAWLDKLSAAANVEVRDFDSYMAALRKRHEEFHCAGCRLSDHDVETGYGDDYTDAEIRAIFGKLRSGRAITAEEVGKFKSAMLFEFGCMDAEKGWTQQFHIGALRNVNSRMFEQFGPDAGCDTMGDWAVAQPLARMFDRLDRRGTLPRTILYILNPAYSAVIAAMIGNFQGGIPGKMQYGGAWWFLDQKDGMEQHLRTLANSGLLGRFIGMAADSRSFLSYTRHEYFRRVLCNLLGGDMENGELPDDFALVGGMVKDISYNNAKTWFLVD